MRFSLSTLDKVTGGFRDFGIQHPASGIQHPASSIQHPASGFALRDRILNPEF